MRQFLSSGSCLYLRMIRFVLFLIVFFPCLAGAASIVVEKRPLVTLTTTARAFSLHTTGAPLSTILERITQATGIPFLTTHPTEERFSLALSSESVEEGIHQLLRYYDTVFVYEAHSNRLARVHILGPRDGRVDLSITNSTASEVRLFDERDIDATRQATALQLQDLEAELRTLPTQTYAQASARIWSLLEDPDSAVRVTALQWGVAREDLALDTFVTALRDSDVTVRDVAIQLLRERGASQQSVEDILEATQMPTTISLQPMVESALPPPNATSFPQDTFSLQ